MEKIQGRPYAGSVRDGRYQSLLLENQIGEATHVVEDTSAKDAVCLTFNEADANNVARALNEYISH